MFTVDDLKLERQAKNINSAGMTYRLANKSYFQTDTGNKGWKFRGGFTKGKGFRSYHTPNWSSPSHWSGRGFGFTFKRGKGKSPVKVYAAKAYGRPRGRHTGAPSSAYGRHNEHNCPRGKIVGDYPPSSKVGKVLAMVAKESTRSSTGPYSTWSGVRHPTGGYVVSEDTTKKARRAFAGKSHIAGLPGVRDCQVVGKMGTQVYPPPYSMVYHFQRGKQQSEAQTHFRLQGIKSIFHSKNFQVGSSPNNFPLLENRLVGCKVGFERCIFSSASEQKSQKICQTTSWPGHLGV
jgi:hypothetical protein